MNIRKFKIEDIDSIIEIQNLSYPIELCECKDIFESISLNSDLCFVAEKDNKICGYLFAHFWDDIYPPELHNCLDVTHKPKSCFIHDLAVHPDFRNIKIGKTLLNTLLDKIKHLTITLVAVNNAYKFWIKYGFEKQIINEDYLSSYGENAVFLIKS